MNKIINISILILSIVILSCQPPSSDKEILFILSEPDINKVLYSFEKMTLDNEINIGRKNKTYEDLYSYLIYVQNKLLERAKKDSIFFEMYIFGISFKTTEGGTQAKLLARFYDKENMTPSDNKLRKYYEDMIIDSLKKILKDNE